MDASEELTFSTGVQRSLGEARAAGLADAFAEVSRLAARVEDASSTEFWVMPMDPLKATVWGATATAQEGWVYVQRTDGYVLAVDEATAEGARHPMEAVAYPEIQSHLAAWWLFHAWRGADLTLDALNSLARWRVHSAPVSARALLEQVGCLVFEAKKLFRAWAEAKSGPAKGDRRAQQVHDSLRPVQVKLGLGTRLPSGPEKLKAPNVMDYIRTLADSDSRFTSWYDWLTDAAHPAFGARIVSTSQPAVHRSGATSVRIIARGVLSMSQLDSHGREMPETTRAMENEIALRAADATIAAAAILVDVLQQSSQLLEDFALTTNASSLTSRRIWGALERGRPSDRCPCGCGLISKSRHKWGRQPPTLKLPRRDAGESK